MIRQKLNPSLESEVETAFPVQELDEVLAALRSVKPGAGFEGRVLDHLQRESRIAAPLHRSGTTLLRRWAPLGIAASLVCVLAGAVGVEREYSLSLPSDHATQASITVAGAQAESSAAAAQAGLSQGAGSFGTASARREPAGAIPAGTRRGRATRVRNASSRRIHAPQNTAAQNAVRTAAR